MSKRLYVSDLDGTLLTSKQTLSLTTAQGINLLREKDIYFKRLRSQGFNTNCLEIPTLKLQGRDFLSRST